MPKKILIVDDEPDIRELLSLRFEASGFECLMVKDGREALNIAKEQQPSLIILDLIMPKMDGFKACKALKARNIPIIVYTAHPGGVNEKVSKEGLKSVDLDIVDFLMKPFDAKALISAVNKAPGNKR